MTKGQELFIQQRAQQLLVEWCDKATLQNDVEVALDDHNPYVIYACTRPTPWISQKAPGRYKILSPGWAAATTFLKR